MVLTFKLAADDIEHHQVDLETFKRLTQNNWPWFQQRGDGGWRRLGVCPWCDNPVQLVGLQRQHGGAGPRPHGRHLNHRAEGFEVFDPHKLQGCPYQRKGRPFERSEKQPPSPTALKIRRMAIDQFDRVMLVLKEATGINFSPRIAAAMLEAWLGGEEWRYAGASLRNVPWMLLYFAPNIALRGQYLRKGGDLVDRLARVTDARGQVVVDCAFGLHCTDHKIVILDDDTVEESMILTIRDYAASGRPSQAPLVLEKPLVFDHAHFETLRLLDPDHPGRNSDLRNLAGALAERFPVSGYEGTTDA